LTPEAAASARPGRVVDVARPADSAAAGTAAPARSQYCRIVAKFLVIWQLELGLLSREMAAAVALTPAYAAQLEEQGKIVARYHIAGAHGGVWILDVDSHEELERLLGGAPAYNLAHFDVRALSEMAE
jgi:muconolactone delta-isomerase